MVMVAEFSAEHRVWSHGSWEVVG